MVAKQVYENALRYQTSLLFKSDRNRLTRRVAHCITTRVDYRLPALTAVRTLVIRRLP